MKIAYVFPGQGVQTLGMGKDLYEQYDEVKEIYNIANKVLGMDIAKLTFDSTDETLKETKNAQIAILVMCLGILNVLEKESIEVKVAAGLSLGEYTALIFSKYLELEEGIKLVNDRGIAMQENIPNGNWNMLAIIGLEDNIVEDLCKKVSTKGFIKPVNYNYKGQIVVVCEDKCTQEINVLAKDAGARKIVELKTAGPFHTEMFETAANIYEKSLKHIDFKYNKEIKVLKNLDGEIYQETDDMVEILKSQITNPVKFSKCIDNILAEGIDTVIEIGAGKTVSGFIKKTNKDVKIYNINNVESLENVISILKNKGEDYNG